MRNCRAFTGVHRFVACPWPTKLHRQLPPEAPKPLWRRSWWSKTVGSEEFTEEWTIQTKKKATLLLLIWCEDLNLVVFLHCCWKKPDDLDDGLVWWFAIGTTRWIHQALSNAHLRTKLRSIQDWETIVFKHIFKSVSEYSKNTWLQEITGRIKEAYIEFAYKGLTCTPSLPAYSNLHKHSIKHIWICI